MTVITTTPAATHRILSGHERRVENVWDGNRLLGQITCDEIGDWLWRVKGNPFFVPTATGTRMRAIAEVERVASLPSGWARRIPEKLVIARVADGAVVKAADGVDEDG